MAAVRCACRAFLRRSMSPAGTGSAVLRRAAVLGEGGFQRSRGLHSLIHQHPTAAAAGLLPSMASSRCIITSNRNMSTSSNYQSPRKELAIALMKEPSVTNGDANKEIQSIDELFELLKVKVKSEDQAMKTVAADESRDVIGKKKQELALLLLQEEVEGVGCHGYKEEVTEELVAAARRLRDSLLPQAQHHDLQDLKKKYASLEDRHATLLVYLWMWGVSVTSLLLVVLRCAASQ